MKKTKAERFLEALGEIDEKYIEEAREKTMKKKFNFKPIIAVAACAAFALAAIPVANHFANNDMVDGGTTAVTVAPAPGGEINFTVYDMGAHGGGEQLGTHKIEIFLNDAREEYIDEAKVAKNATINLNGQIWQGLYECNWSKTDYNEAINSYAGTVNGKEIVFDINSVTGKCEYFMFKNKPVSEKDTELTRDELYKIAYDVFLNGNFTDDPENYTLTKENSNGKAGYYFQFSRFLGGIQTSEYVIIALTNSGEFYWFSGNRIGEMKDVDVSGFDMDKLYDAIEVKLKKIYGDAYVGFERDGAILTKLTNGSYVFDYSRDVDVIDYSGELIKDGCFLIVIMD